MKQIRIQDERERERDIINTHTLRGNSLRNYHINTRQRKRKREREREGNEEIKRRLATGKADRQVATVSKWGKDNRPRVCVCWVRLITGWLCTSRVLIKPRENHVKSSFLSLLSLETWVRSFQSNRFEEKIKRHFPLSLELWLFWFITEIKIKRERGAEPGGHTVGRAHHKQSEKFWAIKNHEG